MKFTTKDKGAFEQFIDDMCEKNGIEGTNAMSTNYDNKSGMTTIELGAPFLNRLKAASKDDFDLLVQRYGD